MAAPLLARSGFDAGPVIQPRHRIARVRLSKQARAGADALCRPVQA
jgi:hypothetical protein